MKRLLALLFPCKHPRLTWPQGNRKYEHYPVHVTCVTCGQAWEYSWQEMKIGRPIPPH